MSLFMTKRLITKITILYMEDLVKEDMSLDIHKESGVLITGEKENRNHLIGKEFGKAHWR